MSSTDLLVMGGVTLFGLLLLGGGLSIAAVGASRVRTARTLRAAGPVSLRAVPETSGFVEFGGTAQEHDGQTLEAPITGTTCLAYTVQSRARDGSDEEGEPIWTVDGRQSAGVPFAVEDGVDRVVVDPANAVFSGTDWVRSETTWTDHSALSPDERDRLQTTELPKAVAPTDESRQYREQRLEAGHDVHVFGGTVRESSDHDGGRHTPVTVAGDDWLEITTGGEPTVLADRQRSGVLYLIFGGLLSIPGSGFTLAGVVGLLSTTVL
ncbi:hypothetical protein [Natronorubrum sulfidifaciens]|uniref:RING-type E3 ubiquitin transferase n=1 Tax=Natronorubrum sulfidifaciens JCM 14089 TaxID=1230460 RepID=L9W533_9EURY|nr:hypothetical protein [Natronorubrum sulfidifaciens]ELY44574.1 hypothetical protein C495_11754 [Natronorubrum sulfidifaciens JCM 14089]